ncbi:MAG: iron chelate uptake ABC transporter family permease subunit [Phycisphaerales bacterium]
MLGVSGGAGLGVMTAMHVGWATGGAVATGALGWLLGGERLLVPAAIGAMAALALVHWLGRRAACPIHSPSCSRSAIVSSMCGACIMLLQHLVPQGLRGDLLVWMMGRIPEAIDRRILGAVAVLTLAGVALGAILGRAMDAATFGDDGRSRSACRFRGFAGRWESREACSPRRRWRSPVRSRSSASSPHAARRLLGPRHAPLAIASALAGASLMLAADCLRQIVDLGGGRVPVGVFTALAGGPVFLALMRSGRGDA